MRMLKLRDESRVAEMAADVVCGLLGGNEHPVVAIPTGKTPLALYSVLIARQRAGATDLSGFTWFALDEFLGVDVRREATFGHFLESRFILPAGLPVSSVHTPDFATDRPEQEGADYEEQIRQAGGLDLAILGIGLNGHIGFNEPGTPLDSRTGARTLAPATRQANAYLFPESDVPRTAISMGIATILEARRIMVLATGASKAGIVKQILATTATRDLPASALVLLLDCLLLVDEAAGALV